MTENPRGEIWSVWEDEDGTWQFFGSTVPVPAPVRARFKAVGVVLAVSTVVGGLAQDELCSSWPLLALFAAWTALLGLLAWRWSDDP